MRLTTSWIAAVGVILQPAAFSFAGALDEGIECNCSRTGPYNDPDPGSPPFVGADGLSPGGVYRVSVSGSGPLELTITRVATGQTVVRLTVPANSAWGFSPDDHRFVYHYVTTPVHNVFLHNLEASNPGEPVRTFAVATGVSRIVFSAHGEHMLYAAITATSYTSMYIVGARTGAMRFQTNFTFQTPPGTPGDELGVVGWGWSPDLADRTFVYAYVSGQNSVEFFIANLHANPAQVYSETIFSWSAFWQFSPCGDVLAIVKQPNASQVSIRLFRTLNGRRITSPQETFPLAPVSLLSTSESHVAIVGGTSYVLAANSASQTCPPPATLSQLRVAPTIIPGGGAATGTVTLTSAAPTGGLAVALSSDNPAAYVPASVTVPQGQTRQNFPINTSTVTSTVTARITAVHGTVTRTADLTIVPQASFCPAVTSTTWQVEVPGWALSVAMDPRGNVVAGGSTFIPIGALFSVLNLDGTSSAELWRQTINGSALHPIDQASSVVVDPAGDVVAAGFIFNNGTQFAVAKFDGRSGALLWEQEIVGTNPNGLHWANAVTVDRTGDVVALGKITNLTTSEDFTVVKFDGATGAELWRQVIDGTAHIRDEAQAVAVDATGNVLAAGGLTNAGSGFNFLSFTVIKFDGATGAELWRQEISPDRLGISQAIAVAVDSAGNVVAAGTLQELDVGRGMAVMKFDGTNGAQLWRQMIFGSANFLDAAEAVRVDGADNVVAAGYTTNAGTNSDFTVAKLDRASGALLWSQILNGTANDDDVALSIDVDAVGDVLAGGYTRNYGVNSSFTVVKFNGVSGAMPWCRVINGTGPGSARAVTVDPVGNVVAAGGIRRPSGDNFTVVKLRGTDGGDL